MLGSALIAVQPYEGTAIVASTKEEQEAYIADHFEDIPHMPLIRCHYTGKQEYKFARRDSNGRFKGWTDVAKPYEGEKPKTIIVLVPKDAVLEHYNWMGQYGVLHQIYSYFYQRAAKMIFVQQKDV